MHLTLNVFSTNWGSFRVFFFCCGCCFFFFCSFFFIHFSLSFFFSVVTSNNFFFGVENRTPRSSRRHSLDNYTAHQYRLCLQGLGSLRNGQESWIFRCSQCSKPSKDEVDSAKACLVPLKKKLSLRDVSKPEVPFTGQPANLHRANTRIERKDSWWALVASHCFRSSYLDLVTVLRNPWKGLTLTAHWFGGTCRSGKDVPWRNLAAIDLPVDLPRSWQFTVPFCSCNQERYSFCAIWQCQIRARLGKKKPTSYPWSLNRERTLGRRNGLAFISLHAPCTSCFVRFRCHPPFWARNFDE